MNQLSIRDFYSNIETLQRNPSIKKWNMLNAIRNLSLPSVFSLFNIYREESTKTKERVSEYFDLKDHDPEVQIMFEMFMHNLTMRSHFAESMSKLGLPVSHEWSVDQINGRLEQRDKLYDELQEWHTTAKERRATLLKILRGFDDGLQQVSVGVDKGHSSQEEYQDLIELSERLSEREF